MNWTAFLITLAILPLGIGLGMGIAWLVVNHTRWAVALAGVITVALAVANGMVY